MRKKSLIITTVVIAVFSLLIMTASGGKEKVPEKPSSLTVLTMTGPWISGPAKVHGKEFEEQTGIKIEVVEAAFADIFPKVQQAAATKSDAFDILLVANIWMADMVGWNYVIPLDDYIAQPEVKYDADVPDGIKRKNTFGGKTYGLICDNDNMYLFYRKDILNNKDYQNRFKKKYGYSYNVPPQTIDELIDVAEFLNNWDWDNDGEVEYGFVRSTRRGAQTYWYSFPWAAPYTVIPVGQINTPGIFFFDPETMKPLVNTPGFVKGIEKFVEMGKRGCGPGLDWERANVINEMILGHAAMAIDWGDIGPNSYAEQSVVKGKLGYAMPPGTKEYYDWRSKKWVKTDKINYAPVHCFNGWSWYITSTTKYQEQAWQFVKYMISPEISSFDVSNPFSGYQPWRKSHLEDLDNWVNNGWEQEDARAYLKNTIDVTNSPNAVIDMRIPGASDYSEGIYETYLTTALSGEKTVQQAMDTVAKEWDALTDRLGRDKQIEFYQWHLNYR
jgi:multiple sugar transport system substrate-binding protein